MHIEIHQTGDIRIAEVISDNVLISSQEDALQLIVDIYYQGFERMIIHEKNITPRFFDLRTGLAGDVLQKFTNYKMRVAIIGEFSKYPGKSIRDFIYESNKGRQVNFLESTKLAVAQLSK